MLAPRNRLLLDSALASDHHAFLMIGRAGIGFTAAVEYVLESLYIKPSQSHVVVPDAGKDISIDQIRHLYESTRSVRDQPFAVIINHAHTMSHAAQHALLKLLEEPPKNVLFILSTAHKELLLPTIISRVVPIELKPLSTAESKELLVSGDVEPTKRDQILFMASGLADEIQMLSQDDPYFAQRSETITSAKRFLTTDTYTRLSLIKDVTDRHQAISFAQSIGSLLLHISRRGVSPSQASSSLAIAECIDALEAHANHKITLTQLALKL